MPKSVNDMLALHLSKLAEIDAGSAQGIVTTNDHVQTESAFVTALASASSALNGADSIDAQRAIADELRALNKTLLQILGALKTR